MLDATNAPVYSVAIAMLRPGSTPAQLTPELIPLPDGWQSTRFIRGDSLHLVLAGPMPLPPGDLLLFPTPPPVGVAVALNDRRVMPEAPAPVSPPEQPAVDLTLASTFPNPFSRHTTFIFQLPTAGLAQLTVYDLLGRAVARPLDGWLEAGDPRGEPRQTSLRV